MVKHFTFVLLSVGRRGLAGTAKWGSPPGPPDMQSQKELPALVAKVGGGDLQKLNYYSHNQKGPSATHVYSSLIGGHP